jgi:hypothetical protein
MNETIRMMAQPLQIEITSMGLTSNSVERMAIVEIVAATMPIISPNKIQNRADRRT